MSTTEDISTIDEKKAEESGTSTASPDFKGFITNYLSSIIFTIGIGIFIIGGLGLYTTKVAQSNILPDDIELAPYTIFDRIVDDKCYVDINIMRPSFFSENKETLSQKVKFNSQEYLDSFNKSFLCSFKKSADPNAGLFSNAPLYFSFVYDNLVAKNFLAINTIFFYLNYLPEYMIMLLYGIFGIFLWIGLYFFNVCISIFYHIINIPQLFRTVSEENNKQWESMESISFIRFMKLILFFFLWIPVGALSVFITPAFFTIYGLISPLFAKYNIKNGKNDNNVSNFLYSNLVYKKLFFFILATLSLLSNGIKYLGTNSIVGIVVAIIFAYFMGLYTNEMPEPGTDGFSFKIRQHMKQCKVFDRDNDEPKLVEICERIPINDEKMKELISRGVRRELTKPKEVGGDADYEDSGEEFPVTKEMDNFQPTTPSLDQIGEPTTPSLDQIGEPTTPSLDQIGEPTTPSLDQIGEPTTPSLSRLKTLQNKLILLENELAETEQADIGHGKEAMDQQYELRRIKNNIDDITKEIETLSPEQGQLGGKKQKKLNFNKKYNIRWT
jgi:hypothetical protein